MNEFEYLDSSFMLVEKIDSLRDAIVNYLKENEVDITDKRLSVLIDKFKELYKITEFKKRVREYVTIHGGAYNEQDFLASLDSLRVMEPSKVYLGFELNDEGYVKNVAIIHGYTELEDVPTDLTFGYYKLENNKLVRDDAMMAKLWEG